MRKRIGAMWVALGALVVGVLAYLLGVANVLGQRAEASVLEASSFNENPPAPLSLVSVPTVIAALLVIAVIALWCHGIGRAFSVVVSVTLAIVASQMLKETWLERPQLFELEAWNTFPSGHMTIYTALCGGLIWAVSGTLRPLVGIMSAFLLGIVAWQLLHFGWHRPSDLLGAQALVVLAFTLAAWLGPRASRRPQRRTSLFIAGANKVLLITLTLSGLVVFVGGAGLTALAAFTRTDALMLSASTIAMIGVSAVSARVIVRLTP